MAEIVEFIGDTKYVGDDGRSPPPEEQDEDCPVTAIGHNDGVYYYVRPNGELRQLTADRHTRNNIF